MLSVTFTGTGDYGYTNMINAGATMGLGHVTIEPRGYNQTPALDKRLLKAEQIREHVLTTARSKRCHCQDYGPGHVRQCQ